MGVVWQGNPRHKWDRHRSFPLALLEPVARVEGVTLVSLQRDAGAEQVALLKDRFPILDLGPELGDFTDTAALIQCLDLVICCDTAVGAFGGGAGCAGVGGADPPSSIGAGCWGETIVRGTRVCGCFGRSGRGNGAGFLSGWRRRVASAPS